MGNIFCKSLEYKFDNFIKVVDKYPYQTEDTRIERFQFKVDRFSIERAHELDQTFDPNLVSINSFLVAEPNRIVIFEQRDLMITNRSNIIERFQMTIQHKMVDKDNQGKLNYLVFLEPVCKDIYKQTILEIILQTLINIDLTWSRQNNQSLGVYFDWADYIKQIGIQNFMQKIKQSHNPTAH